MVGLTVSKNLKKIGHLHLTSEPTQNSFMNLDHTIRQYAFIFLVLINFIFKCILGEEEQEEKALIKLYPDE